MSRPKVIDGDRPLRLVLKSVGQRSGGRLIDDAQHLQPGNEAGIFGGLPLTVVKIGGNRDDGLRNAFAEGGLCPQFQFLEDHAGDLWR